MPVDVLVVVKVRQPYYSEDIFKPPPLPLPQSLHTTFICLFNVTKTAGGVSHCYDVETYNTF